MVSTRAANKNTHPGEPDMPTHRRSSSRVRADNALAESEQEAMKKLHRAKLRAVVAMEERMAVNKAHAIQRTAHQSMPAGRWLGRPLACTDTLQCDEEGFGSLARTDTLPCDNESPGPPSRAHNKSEIFPPLTQTQSLSNVDRSLAYINTLPRDDEGFGFRARAHNESEIFTPLAQTQSQCDADGGEGKNLLIYLGPALLAYPSSCESSFQVERPCCGTQDSQERCREDEGQKQRYTD